jgi:hypothetical protein
VKENGRTLSWSTPALQPAMAIAKLLDCDGREPARHAACVQGFHRRQAARGRHHIISLSASLEAMFFKEYE